MKPFHLYLTGPDRGPIDSSFEAASERLCRLPRLHFEPDGSFAWVRDQGEPHQQVYGMLYDALGKIQSCEIRGQCQFSTWRELCLAIAGDDVTRSTLQAMLLPEQRLQDLQTFERTQWSDFAQPRRKDAEK